MKKYLIVLLLFISVTSFGQRYRPFLDPISENPYFDKSKDITADRGNGIMVVRGAMSLSATQLLYNKVEKYLKPVAFEKLGVGLTYSHYKALSTGEPYNDYSVNGFLFFPLDGNSSVSFAITGSVYQYFQLGFGFEPKLIKSDYFPVYPFLGLKYNF